MEAIVECCAGLDVHQATVVACLNRGPPTKRSHKEVRTFGTTRHELGKMRDWLLASDCTLVAMESTGIYWRPVYGELEHHFDLTVGNAQHIKNVPGRKTDVKDCEWISDLARHGLIAKSFVPPRPIRDLRDLTRYRRKLSQNQAAERIEARVAVDHRNVLNLGRNTVKESLHDPGRKAEIDERGHQDKTDLRVDQAQLRVHDEIEHKHGDRRNHAGRQDEEQEIPMADKAEARRRIARERPEHDGEERPEHRDHD